MIEMIIGQVWPYVLGALAIIAGLLGFGASQRARGREQERVKMLEEAREARRKADEIAEKVRRMDDSAVSDRLKSGWVRGPK